MIESVARSLSATLFSCLKTARPTGFEDFERARLESCRKRITKMGL
jgi:hypothetical protein